MNNFLTKLLLNFFIYLIHVFLITACTNFSRQQTEVHLPKSTFNNQRNFEKESEIYQNLTQLEEFESYRPDSCSDMSRNPFGPKRYNFLELKNSLGK